MQLFRIIQEHDLESMKKYLADGGEANLAVPESHWSLLHHAVFYSDFEMAELLNRNGARQVPLMREFSPRKPPYPIGTTPLEIAREAGDPAIVELLGGIFTVKSGGNMDSSRSVYAFVIAGKVYDLDFEKGRSLIRKVDDSPLAHSLNIKALSCGDLNGEGTQTSIIVGIPVHILELPDEFVTHQGQGSSQFGISLEISSSEMKTAWIKSHTIPPLFWMSLDQELGIESSSDMDLYLSSNGPLCLARLKTPYGKVIEAGLDGTLVQSVEPANGIYTLEAQYD